MKNVESYKKILKKIAMECGEEDLSNMDKITVEGIDYSFEEIEELNTIDEGKYQYGGTVYGIGIFDEEKGYGIKEVLFYIEQDFSQTGSYYEYQERSFDKPYIVEKREVIKTVWESI